MSVVNTPERSMQIQSSLTEPVSLRSAAASSFYSLEAEVLRQVAATGSRLAETIDGVEAAWLRISGSAKEPNLHASFILAQGSAADRTMAAVGERVFPRLEFILGAPFLEQRISFTISSHSDMTIGSPHAALPARQFGGTA